MFLCDFCGLRIEKAREGMALWKPEGRDATIVHAHKGVCDPGRGYFWEELDVHLVYLANNLKIGKKEWRDANERADHLSQF
jgi:hypothetical protein